ncbi:helix-turn-helix domain-containing protein [Herbiconiux moechotypicola]|uniref:PucR family transcriptional regulator ligand-binding domain-containing protein n=1 Tax=Herbiconiux moechotypicola TaxID=637393 RepID=A0ABP5QID0_9MICO|nr:helix-turn-helix domain-containing protein [Herbiconiux moechotypicola]MCS5729976.1 helix-turn-helix domain-containing protein [Herbiconiux moechotypicola]
MRIAQLVRESGFDLTVLAGTEEALQREAEGAFLTDLTDPGRFLGHGVVVFSNGQWARSPEGVERFTTALAAAGATALVIGLLEIGSVPDAVIARCRALDIPLIVTGDDVAYSEVAAYILESLESDVARTIAQEFGFVRRLAVQPLGADRLDSVLRQFAAEFEVDCWLMDAAGAVIGSAGAPLAADDAVAAWHAARRSPSHAVDLALGGDATRVWTLASRDTTAAAHFGVRHRDPERLPQPDSVLVLSLRNVLEAALAELQFEQTRAREGVRRLVQRFGQEGVTAIDLFAHYRSEGANPSRPSCVVVAAAGDATLPAEAVLAMVTAAFDGPGVTLGTTVDRRAIVFVNGPERLGAEELDRAAARLGDARGLLGGSRLRVGVSDVVRNVGELPEALAQAGDRLRGIVDDGQIVLGVDATAQTHRSLLGLIDADRVSSFHAALLGVLEEYDRRHGSALIESLRTFLSTNGVWLTAAEALHIHPNTLRYRMRRVEELTGRRLDSPEDRLDFALALSVHG